MRLIFRCTDGEGNLVEVVTSEWEAKGLEPSAIPKMKEFISSLGLTPVKAYKGGKAREKILFDGKTCPKCGAKMWDNRERNAAAGKKGPDFRCSNAECTGATPDKNDPAKKWPFSLWSGSYEIAEAVPANGNGHR